MSAINYRESLQFAEKINQIESGGKKLNEMFFYGKYNIWYFYQAAIFNDSKQFNKSKQLAQKNSISVKGHIASIALLFYSFISFCYLLIKRKKVLFLSVDASNSKYSSDFRMQSLYRLLSKLNVSFFEIFHAIPGKKTAKNILKRKRAALYLESIDYIYYLLHFFQSSAKSSAIIREANLSNFSGEEKIFAEQLVKKYVTSVPHVKFRIQFFGLLLKILGIELILSIDDVRNYNELLVAATELGIPSFVFQHGHYSKYHRGFLKHNFLGKAATPTYLFVWNEYWKQELERLDSVFIQNQIIVSGSTHDVSGFHGGAQPLRDSSDISILIPFETDAPKQEVMKFMNIILSNPQFQLIFKIRPDRDKLMQIHEYGLSLDHPRLHVVRSLSEIVGDVSVACGVYSTFLYDMVAIRKPVCMMDTSMDYGEGLVFNKLAERVSLDGLSEHIIRIAHTPESVLQERFDRLEGVNPKNFETTVTEYLQRYEII